MRRSLGVWVESKRDEGASYSAGDKSAFVYEFRSYGKPASTGKVKKGVRRIAGSVERKGVFVSVMLRDIARYPV